METAQVQQTTNWVVNAVWPIVVLGGAGAFVDFVLGTTGQMKVKDWLLRNWVKFEDLTWPRFAEGEVRYFIRLSDACVGKDFFSIRRWIACGLISLGVFAFWLINAYYLIGTEHLFVDQKELIKHDLFGSLLLAHFTFALVMLNASFEITRRLSSTCLQLSIRFKSMSLLFYFALVIAHILIFICWWPIIDALRIMVTTSLGYEDLSNSVAFSCGGADSASPTDSEFLCRLSYLIPKELKEIFVFGLTRSFLSILETYRSAFFYSDLAILAEADGSIFVSQLLNDVQLTVSAISNAVRFLLSILVLCTFIVRRWFTPALSLIWLRVVEDQKGAFTLILGGIGTLASAIKEIASHL